MPDPAKPVKPAMMVIYMNITDPSWVEPYFKVVPGLLEEYGAISLGASRRIESIEGDWKAPERLAVISFPSMEKLKAFMADERYAPYKDAREKGASTNILVFENAVAGTTKLSV